MWSALGAGYQVDEFTHTWSAEWIVAHSQIYHGFTGKMPSLNHFPLEPGCENYSFLDQAVVDFEQGWDSILTDSINIPELDTCFDEPDVIHSSPWILPIGRLIIVFQNFRLALM